MFFGRMGRAGRRCRTGRPFNSFYYMAARAKVQAHSMYKNARPVL